MGRGTGRGEVMRDIAPGARGKWTLDPVRGWTVWKAAEERTGYLFGPTEGRMWADSNKDFQASRLRDPGYP